MKLQYEDLYSQFGLTQINQRFLHSIKVSNFDLHNLYLTALDGAVLAKHTFDDLLIELAKNLEDFLSEQFGINNALATTYKQKSDYSLIAYAKRHFVQRYALKKFPHSHDDWQNLYEFKDEITFATEALDALDQSLPHLDNLAKYAAWAVFTKQNHATLFDMPAKIDHDFILNHVQKIENSYTTTRPRIREGFNLTDPGLSNAQACAQSHYCILCHNQGRDSCRTGLDLPKKSSFKPGCPLDQKISQMHFLKKEALNLAALAVIMVDNPMVAVTGHRICNDCMRACIFQKQDPVNTPGVETNILNEVLNLPYGFEIYSLLTRWNPLNFSQALPKAESGYQVLVVGLGPAGFSLAHYLSNEGHKVVGIDGAKLEPLPPELLDPDLIKDVNDLYERLDQRILSGFGGVAEYGITARWNKNYLKILRLALERRQNITFLGSTRYGSQITATNYQDLGFDTIAMCTGTGSPKCADIEGASLPGVRLASDFLMTLQLTGAAKEDSLANLQLPGPIIVIGGGLTAIDAATEAKAYYKAQVQKFRQRYQTLLVAYGEAFKSTWAPQDHQTARQFLTHDDTEVHLIYRDSLNNSPSYRLNHLEIEKALEEGIIFEDQVTPLRIVPDEFGWIKGLWVKRGTAEEFIAARSIIMAIGTTSRPINSPFAHFGDAHPDYAGSVVKAIASAKHGYKLISQNLTKNPPVPKPEFSSKAEVIAVTRLAPNLIQLEINAPLAANTFQPGQFYRLQNFESSAPLIHGTRLAMEALALTPVKIDKQHGILTFVIVEIGSSSLIVQHLKPGELVSLMGPTGTTTTLPSHQNVLLIGGGHFNLALLHLAQALKTYDNNVFWIAGYHSRHQRKFIEAIETAADHLWWYSNDANIDGDINVGNVVDGLDHLAHQEILPTIDWIFAMGTTAMQQAIATKLEGMKNFLKPSLKTMANANIPMQCMMQGICGQCLITTGNDSIFCCKKQEWQLQTMPFSKLQKRSKQNSLLEKISQKWLEYITEGA